MVGNQFYLRKCDILVLIVKAINYSEKYGTKIVANGWEVCYEGGIENLASTCFFLGRND